MFGVLFRLIVRVIFCSIDGRVLLGAFFGGVLFEVLAFKHCYLRCMLVYSRILPRFPFLLMFFVWGGGGGVPQMCCAFVLLHQNRFQPKDTASSGGFRRWSEFVCVCVVA